MKLILISFVSLFITCFIGFIWLLIEKANRTYGKCYNEGIEFYLRGEYREAQSSFLEAIQKNPDYYEAYYNLGLAQLALNSLSNAEKNFIKAISLNPKDADSYFNLGLVEQFRKNYRESIKYLEEGISLNDKDAESFYNLSVAYYNLSEIEEAKINMTKALALSPNNFTFKNYFIKILADLTTSSISGEDVDMLIQLYKEVLESDPENQDILYKLAVCYAKTGSWEDSVFFCERIIKINPNSYDAHNQYGLALYCKGEVSESIKMYERAIELNPKNDAAYANIAFAYEKANKFDKAIEMFNYYIAKFPKGTYIEIIKDYVERLAKTES